MRFLCYIGFHAWNTVSARKASAFTRCRRCRHPHIVRGNGHLA